MFVMCGMIESLKVMLEQTSKPIPLHRVLLCILWGVLSSEVLCSVVWRGVV